jgi:hypothetical protein
MRNNFELFVTNFSSASAFIDADFQHGCGF